jgi:hypothetical protein
VRLSVQRRRCLRLHQAAACDHAARERPALDPLRRVLRSSK